MAIRDITQIYYKNGLKDEEFVMKLTKEKWGGIVNKATSYDDINSHIDFFWQKNEASKQIGFDVKGLRKNKRSGEFDETITWLELRAVNDRPGSIFGKAKYFAFITTKSVIYIQREKLIELLKDKIEFPEIIEKCKLKEKIMTDEFMKKNNLKSDSHNMYELHTRIYDGIKRLDISVKVPMDEIRKLSKQELVF